MFKSWMIAMVPTLLAAGEVKASQKQINADYVAIEDLAKVPLLNPSLQKREIAKIRLKNGIAAYIVSDPEAKHSAMAVSVKAGSWNDPKEYAGMAHFVEHVLFMGTKTYPSENDYTQHIMESSGIYNAYTATDRTVYMFAVNHGGFEGAADRLAHFFIDPLLCTSSIERELHAVDQEHAKNLENDDWRQWMILKEISNPGHPHTKFSTGNAETLRGIPQSALRTWFNQQYTPENIRVVVISPLPKDTLVDLVASRFSLVQRDPSSKTSLNPDLPLFSKQQRGTLVSIQPMRDTKELALLWELPCDFCSLDAEGSLHFLTYLLSSPHEGGLIDHLKQEGWIQEGKMGFDRLSNNTVLFSINFELTEAGVLEKEQIFEKTFQTLDKISKKTPYERLQEMKQLSLIHYQYQTRQDAFRTVSQLAHKMFDEELSTFPEKTFLIQDFPSELFAELLEALRPEKACFLLTADERFSGIQSNRKERWMNAEYSMIPYSETTLAAWARASSDDISLPSANPFVPDHLALLQDEKTPAEPQLAVQSDQAHVYHLRDSFYQVPEVAISYRIHTPTIDGSARAAALAELFCSAFNDTLHSTLHMAKVAGLNATLLSGHHYVQLNINGYSEKTPKLADALFTKLKDLHLYQERFAVLKEQLMSTYANASKELPYMQGKELLDNLLITATPTQNQKLEELKSIDYEDFLAFSEEAFKTIYLEGFIYGNCTQQAAINLSSRLLAVLNAEIFPKDLIERRKVRLLPLEDGPYVVTESTPSLGEATLLAIQQGPHSYDRRARQIVLGRYLHELFFDRLRTKQQTGYLVKAKDSDLEGQLLQLFLVQSSSHHTQELLARFDLFLDEINQEFKHLVSQESFDKTRSMVLQELKLPPENLQSMGSRYTMLCFEYNASFDHYSKLIASVENLEYEDVHDFLHETLSRNNTKRLAVLVEGKMPGKRPFLYRKVAKEEVGAIGELEPRQYR